MSRFSIQMQGSHVMVTGKLHHARKCRVSGRQLGLTGHAGGTKGIGRGIVEAFLAEGANVSYCARSVRGDEFALFKDGAAETARAVGTAVDVQDSSSLQSWVDAAVEEFRQTLCAASAYNKTGIQT